MLQISDITTSVEHPQQFILDSHAKKGIFSRDARGRLIRFTGGFTVVYPYTLTNGEKWAFRCWYTKLGNVQRRLEIISAAIQNAKLPYLCDFIYVDKGINVGGDIYPTTRMRWVEGTTIKKYICANFRFRDKMLSLAEKFLLLIKDMHQHSFAHGDLQHGNILVDQDEKLYLVDYDSFYCPQLSGEKDIITGLKDYQHPSRSRNKYVSEKIDYFSEIIIYLSILGIAYNPTLCSKYKMEDTEWMLFKQSDFENIDASNIYKDLIGLDAIFKPLLDILKLYLSKKDIQDLEPFDILLDKMTRAPEIIRFDYAPKASFFVGDKIKLTWDVIDSLHTFVNGQEVKNNSCEQTISKVGINSFILRSSNGFKQSEKEITIEAYAVPRIKFTSNALKFKKGKGDECVLRWHVENEAEVYFEDGTLSEKVEANGEKCFKPEKTENYYIKAIGLDNKREFVDEIVIGVYEEAVVNFECSPKQVIVKEPAMLSWNVQNAKRIELVGFGEVASSDNKVVNPEKATDYILRVTDEFGIKDYVCHLKTWNSPKIEFKSACNKLNRDKKEKAQISWSVSNAKSATLDVNGTISDVKLKGHQILELAESSNLVIRVIGLDGKTEYEKQLYVAVFNEAVIEFSVDRKYTLPDVPIELRWDVKNAKNVELKGFGRVKASGTKSLKIDSPSTFTLLVTDEFGSKAEKIEVKMLPLPHIKSLIIPLPEFSHTMNVKVVIPKMVSNIPFPHIQMPGVCTRLPHMHDWDGVFHTFDHIEGARKFSGLKSIFTHFYKKLH